MNDHTSNEGTGRTPSADTVATLLQDHLERRAGAVVPSPAPVRAIAQRSRTLARRRTAAVAVATLAVVAGGTALAAPRFAGDGRAAPATSSDPGPDGRWGVLEVPTRGDLAGDRDLVRAAEQAQVPELGDGRLGHVIFAGHVGDRGVAVVAVLGRPASNARAAVVAFWSGTGEPRDLQQVTGFVPDLPYSEPEPAFPDVSVAVGAPGGPRYVVSVPLVVTESVEVSAGPQVAADGSVHRAWTRVPVQDGVAVAPLDDTVSMQRPLVRVDGRPDLVAPVPRPNTPEQVDAFVRDLTARWLGPPPSVDAVRGAIGAVLEDVPVDEVEVTPLSSSPATDTRTEMVSARVRLEDGSTLYVAARYEGRPGRTPAVETTLPGRAVPAGTRAPVVWLDDVSQNSDGVTRARARVVTLDGVRTEIRDVGKGRPCGPSRLYGSGTPDGTGLATVTVDLPAACAGDLPTGESRQPFARIVAVTYDAAGREIGRTPVQLAGDLDLPDTPDRRKAANPAQAGSGG